MPDARQEGAVFAPRSVGPRRKRPPLAALGIMAVLGGIIAIGALGGPTRAPELAALPSLERLADQTPASTRTPRPRRTAPPAVVTPEPGLIALDLRPSGSHLFVHGDVFTDRIVVVVVSLQDAGGSTSRVESITLPGGSTAFRLAPVTRFDVRFDVPDEVMGEGLWIEANGYDNAGAPVESVRRPVVGQLGPL